MGSALGAFIRTVPSAIMAILSVTASQAEEPSGVAQAKALLRCEAISNSVERLACFDTLARKLGPPVESETSPSGEWTVRSDTSKFDDTKSVYVTSQAKQTIKGWPGKSFTPTLIIRCQERKTEAFINFGMSPSVEYGHDGATLEFRMDKQSPFKLVASKSTDGEALFLPDAIGFAKRLLHVNELLVRFVPFNSPPQETWFNVAGVEKAIEPLREACRWPK